MLASPARLTLALALLGLAAGCELVTHSDDFTVMQRAPYQGACNACPTSALDLRHAPCPTDSAAADLDQTFTYAARRFYFGHPDDWSTPESAAAFKLGLDQDCSDRPTGKPVLCQPLTPDGGLLEPWSALPHGIDNALIQRVLGPLYQYADLQGMPFDLDSSVSQTHEKGRYGLMMQVEGWNGTPDDPSVKLSIFASPGITADNGPPRWDGTDVWSRYDDVDALTSHYFTISRVSGYVARGVLVVDDRQKGDIVFRFPTARGTFSFLINNVVFLGGITRTKLGYMTMSAQASLASLYSTSDEAAHVLSGCNPGIEDKLKKALPQLLLGAADMPSDPQNGVDAPCGAISMGLAVDAEAARLGGIGKDLDDAGVCQ